MTSLSGEICMRTWFLTSRLSSWALGGTSICLACAMIAAGVVFFAKKYALLLVFHKHQRMLHSATVCCSVRLAVSSIKACAKSRANPSTCKGNCDVLQMALDTGQKNSNASNTYFLIYISDTLDLWLVFAFVVPLLLGSLHAKLSTGMFGPGTSLFHIHIFCHASLVCDEWCGWTYIMLYPSLTV